MKQLNSSLILIVSAFFLMLGFTMPITVHAAAINAATKTDVTPGTQFTTYKVPVYRLHIANTGDATDTITSLSPTPSGSANDTLVTLRFYLDANNNGFVDQGDTNLGAPAAFASDNTIQTFDITDVTVLAGGSANILITAEGNSVANNTLNFTLSFAAGSGILMTVQPTGTFPLTNANATTFTTTVPSLTIADAANDPAPKSVAAGASNVAVKRLAITAAAGTSDSVVSLAPTPTGTANDNLEITSVVFYIDNGTAGVVDGADIQLSTTPATYTGNDARTIFTFLSPFQVAAGSTVNILIVYNLDAGVTIGDTLYTEIAAVGDVIAGSGTALNGETSTISSLITIAVVDVIDPTVAIADDEAGTANIAGGDVVFTFTFSETVTGFATGDVVVAGGTKGTFTPVSGTVYTLAVTPNLSSITSITVDVAGDVAFDLASNGNTIATQSVQTVDTVAPTVTVTMSDAVLTFGETSLVTFTFSETPVGFTTADVTVANGSIGAIDASIALVQTATYTPTNGITDATNVISVGTDWTDAASNVGGPDDSPNYTIDTIAPQLIVNKVVVNDNGGTKVISNFSLFIDGSSVTSGVASTTTIGLHTVSETSDSGYTTTIGGNCAADGTITLVSGDVKTCTVTNNDIAPGGSGGSVGSYYAPVPPPY